VSDNHQVRLSFVPDDGYTEKGYIKAVPLLHDALRFEFRPFLAEERSKLLREQSELAEEKRDFLIAQAFVAHLVSWDLKDAKGNAIKIDLNIARRLKPALFYRIWAIILGSEASDLDPDWAEDDAAENIEIEKDAHSMPAPIGVAREVLLEKNSDAG